MRLSQDFMLDEFIVSEFAERNDIDNLPPPEAVQSLRRLCERTLQPLRDHLGRPVVITSGYRSPLVNKAIGGSATSQHMEGKAADLVVPGLHPTEVVGVVLHLRDIGVLQFDQLIQEFGRWTHVSCNDHNRQQVLLAYRFNGETVYRPWGVI